jgi:hypothetical protein
MVSGYLTWELRHTNLTHQKPEFGTTCRKCFLGRFLATRRQTIHNSKMTAAFDSAAKKLSDGVPPYPIEDLPTDTSDDLWKDIFKEYDLNLAELGALKNHVREQQSLPMRQQLEQHDTTIEITLLYGRKRETCAVMKNELSLSAILKKARELLKIPVAALAFSYVKDRAEIPLEDNKDVASHITRPNLNACIIRVKNLQESFSSFTSIKDALRLVDATSDNDKLPVSDEKFPKPLTEFSEQQNEELVHAMETIRRLKEVVPIEQSVEATRRLYIDPILLASARVARGGEKDIRMMVEQVYENEFVNGPIDYVLSFEDVTICVTEGKKDSLDRGIAQNIAQLVAVRDTKTRKRKHHEMEEEQQTIFGIATTYVEWSFIRLEGSTIVQTTHRSISSETPDDIKKIVGLIVAILQEGKKKDH